MIRGEVGPGLEPTIEVRLRAPSGKTITLPAAIDTGFSDYVTLPTHVIFHLGLPYIHTVDMVVADNSVVEMGIYEADVIWDGYPRTIYVQESEANPLVGMKLIEGYSLYIEAIDGGEVLLNPLNP